MIISAIPTNLSPNNHHVLAVHLYRLPIPIQISLVNSSDLSGSTDRDLAKNVLDICDTII
jgi:hypothetical protein